MKYHLIKPVFSPYFLLAAVSVLLLITNVIVTSRTSAESGREAHTSERLITLHDNGVNRGILTTAPTLRTAFREAHIQIDPNDLVEPGLDEELVASQYEVNVYRARPVTVIDGGLKTKILSPYQTPEQIVKHAKIELHDEDETETSVNTDMVSQGAGLQLTIDRATPFTLVLYGKRVTAYTQAETVGAMLEQKSIRIAENDVLSSSQNAPIVSGMVVELWRDGKQTITEEQDVPFTTEKIQDADREVGYSEVKTPGVLGKRTVSYEIDMKNGQEVSRKEIQSVVSKEPTKQVEIVGAKQKSFGGTCDTWIAGAGITDLFNAQYLIGKESGCNPYAVNKSSGACGIGQELPCGKSGCELGDGACQMIWMNKYVLGRYGSWQAAADHHRTRGWY